MIEQLEALVREWREEAGNYPSSVDYTRGYDKSMLDCADQLEATIAIIKREKGDE